MYNGKVSTTFAPAENSTFALNGWFMHTQSHYNIWNDTIMSVIILVMPHITYSILDCIRWVH